MSVFSGVVADVVKAASKVKSAVLKAVSEVDNVVLPEAEKLQPTLDAIADAVAPGSQSFIDAGVSLLEEVAGVLDAGGAAAEQGLQNAGLDVAVIQKAKALIPQIKALKK